MWQSTLTIHPQPPFRLDLTAWALRRRPVNKIDNWDGETYSRVLVIGGKPVLIEVKQSGGALTPRLHVTATADNKINERNAVIVPAITRIFGLDVNLKDFYELASHDRRLNRLCHRFLGLRPPRFPSVFEAIANGIACQQLSLHVGLILLNRLSEKCGLAFHAGGETRFSFAVPEKIVKYTLPRFRSLGFSSNKAFALKSLSSMVSSGNFDPEDLSDATVQDALTRLLALRGVGRWTAEYTLLRGVGRIDIFPGDDVGARKKLKNWVGLKNELDYEKVNRLLAKWNPYAGLIYFHLLLDGLEKSGNIISANNQHELVQEHVSTPMV